MTLNTKTSGELLKYVGKLEEENQTLKDNVEFLHSCLDDRDKSIAIMKEENKKLKDNYIKLSKIVETTGGYKASYVNELRDKIAKLEFDIEAWKKLKAVREDKLYSKGEPVVSSGPCL